MTPTWQSGRPSSDRWLPRSGSPRAFCPAPVAAGCVVERERTDRAGTDRHHRYASVRHPMHLDQLQDAGLVASSRDGKNAYYRVAHGNENRGLIELAAAGTLRFEHKADRQTEADSRAPGKSDPFL